MARKHWAIDEFSVEKHSKELFYNEKDFATVFLLFRIDFNSRNSFTPGNINQQMLQDLSSTPLLDNSDMIFNLNGIQKKLYVSNNRLSEVLKLLTKTGLFRNLRSKKEINKIIGCRKSDLKGRPSLYLVSNKIIELEELLSKPTAISMIVTSLNDSRIFSKFIRCMIARFFHFIKDTPKKVSCMMVSIA